MNLHVERSAPPAWDAAGAAAPTAPLVLLHGWGMNLRVFDALRAEVPQHEVWAIDLPGHGRSGWRPDALRFEALRDAVLDALPPRAVLAGWSLGGKLALELAATRPDRVAALVLLAASPRFAQGPDWPHGMDPRSAGHFRALLAQDWRRTLEDFIWLQLRGSRNAEAAQQALQRALLEHGAPQAAALQSGLDLLDDIDLRHRVAQVAQPALLVAGQNDRVTPPAAARWMAAQLPRAQLVEVPRAGHAPHVSHAAEVGEALRAFLAAHAGEIRP